MKQHLSFLFIIITVAAASSQNLRSGGALKPEQAIMDIRHYTVALDVDPVKQTINGYTEIDLKLSGASPVLVFDLWHGLVVQQVLVNGKIEAFVHSENDLLTITGASGFLVGKIVVKVMYGGTPGIALRPPWTGGFQWSKDSKGNPWIAVSCQSEGAKIYFPCKDHPSDEPNEGADMIITVPEGLSVAAPGLLVDVKKSGATTTWHWKTKYTISNYCIVFNVGKYSVVTRTYTTLSGNKVPMDFYVLEEHASKGPHLLEMLERTTRILEKYFGEYPWAKEKIGLAETPHLGMEHQTMIAYGNKFSYTKVGGEDFDWLLNHEFGHEWWANKVTNKDWAHMWIQEGICSYGDALYLRDMAGEGAYIERMHEYARGSQNIKPIVQGEVVDSDDVYQGDIYGKAAFFMHTVRFVIGDNIFFRTLKKLATDPVYTYDNFVTTDDVEKLFSKESNTNLKPLFDFYLRTIQKLDISLKQIDGQKYSVSLLNYDGSLPVEISVDGMISRFSVDKKGFVISSKSTPLIDPNGNYLKRVILE